MSVMSTKSSMSIVWLAFGARESSSSFSTMTYRPFSIS